MSLIGLTSWATISRIFEDVMIFLAVELFIIQKFNPVFFKKVEETINGVWK